MNQKKVNLILLNYNGKGLLEKYLPSVIEASRNSRNLCRVSVIDNKSSDGSIGFVKNNYREVDLYEAKENKVLCSYNDYLKTIDDDIIVILNTDVKADPYFVDPLVEHFDDKDILFVAPKELSMEGEYRGNLNRLSFKLGLISTVPQTKNMDMQQYDCSVGGGAFDRKKILYLGGFDDLYLPGIFEDLDICYRGWKHGWIGIYEPNSFYYHEGGVTFNEQYGNKAKTILAHRNTFLFFWKNITSRKMIFIHIISLPILLVMALVRGRWLFIRGFFQALGMRKAALKRKALLKGQFTITDEEVFRKTQLPYRSKSNK